MRTFDPLSGPSPLAYLRDLRGSSHAGEVRELNILCGCTARLDSFTRQMGWYRLSNDRYIAIVAYLSQLVRDLPNLDVLELGFCPCHSLAELPEGHGPFALFDEIIKLQRVYGKVFAACKHVLEVCAKNTWLRNVTKCRLRMAEWHKLELGDSDMINGAPAMGDRTAMAVIRRTLSLVQSFELVEIPKHTRPPGELLLRQKFEFR